jgi:hypothetical protein
LLQEHGDGLYTWVDGEVFGGQFVDGKPHGLGVKSWPDGERYSGDWFEGERSGLQRERERDRERERERERDWLEGAQVYIHTQTHTRRLV